MTEIEHADQIEAQNVLADVKSTIRDLEEAEVSASGWIKTHVAWTIGLGCLLFGVVVGYVLHR